jgi:hypothetical protein
VCDSLDGISDSSPAAVRAGTSVRSWQELLGPLLDLIGKALALETLDGRSKRELSTRVAALLSTAFDPSVGSGLDPRLVNGLHLALDDGFSAGQKVPFLLR